MMKRTVGVVLAVLMVAGLAGVSAAHWGGGPGQGGHGPMWGGTPGYGPMMGGRPMMTGPGGPGGCAYPGAAGSEQPEQVTEDKARELAQQYADQYLKGYTVERVLPFTTHRGFTVYAVELKGPEGQLRSFHVNPWGRVMPFAPGRFSG